MSELKHSSIKGFSSISTDDFVGFSDIDIANFEVIIHALLDHKQTQKVLAIPDRVTDHIRNGTHDFDLSSYSSDVLASLYNTFRDAGYTGTMADMVLSLVKDIEIGSLRDVMVGISRTKALNTRGWIHLMSAHESEIKNHLALYKQYHPVASFDSRVLYSMDPAIQDLIPEEGYRLPKWPKGTGTIFIDVDFDINYGEQTIAKYDCADGSSISILINSERVVCLRTTIGEDYIDQPTITLEVVRGRCTLVIVGTDDGLLVRNELSQVTVPITFDHPHTLHLIPSAGVIINSIVGYSDRANPAEQIFLLN